MQMHSIHAPQGHQHGPSVHGSCVTRILRVSDSRAVWGSMSISVLIGANGTLGRALIREFRMRQNVAAVTGMSSDCHEVFIFVTRNLSSLERIVSEIGLYGTIYGIEMTDMSDPWQIASCASSLTRVLDEVVFRSASEVSPLNGGGANSLGLGSLDSKGSEGNFGRAASNPATLSAACSLNNIRGAFIFNAGRCSPGVEHSRGFDRATPQQIRMQFGVSVGNFMALTECFLEFLERLSDAMSICQVSATVDQLMSASSGGAGSEFSGSYSSYSALPTPHVICSTKPRFTFVNISSVCAVSAVDSFSYYCAAKAARDKYYETLNREINGSFASSGGASGSASSGVRANIMTQSLPEESPNASSDSGGAGGSRSNAAGKRSCLENVSVSFLSYSPGPMLSDIWKEDVMRLGASGAKDFLAKCQMGNQHAFVDPANVAVHCLRLVETGSFAPAAHVDYFSLLQSHNE